MYDIILPGSITLAPALWEVGSVKRNNLLSSLKTRRERSWRRYGIDTLFATCGALFVTGCIYIGHLYPKIPNISLLYLLLVLGLASTRGRFAAIIASVVAFLAFDFFLVPPLYTFTIGKFDEWLALFMFLVTAIITGQLAADLRRRAEQASQRERETHALYRLVSATNNEDVLERQLHIVAQAIVESFATDGINDCAIFLPDKQGKMTLLACTQQTVPHIEISHEEEIAVEMVMTQGLAIDICHDQRTRGERKAAGDKPKSYRWRRNGSRDVTTTEGDYIRLLPLKASMHSVGVMRLLMRGNMQPFAYEQLPSVERDANDPRTAFFWSFLEQAASIIEHARLHQESLQVELLKRTDELRAALLSSVSHDLRTPLSSIKASASSLLQDDVQWDEETRHSFAQAIEREADRLNRLVGNLLDMSRIEGGALRPEKEWYPVDELIHDVLGHMQMVLKDRPVHICLPADLPPVKLDYLQIDQVMTNLLENATHHTPAGTPIEISAEAQEEQVVISVADRGPGIAAKDSERIFDKFYSVTGGQRKGIVGSGLGLAVCRGLVEAHGGHIWVMPRVGGGALFQFSLPIHMEETRHD